MDVSKLRQLADLSARRKALESEARDLKKKEESLSTELVDDFIQEGVSSLKADGSLFYLHQQAWATSLDDTQLSVTTLLAEGLQSCVTVGSQRLSAIMREMGEEQFFGQYPALKGVIGQEVRSSVRVRKA